MRERYKKKAGGEGFGGGGGGPANKGGQRASARAVGSTPWPLRTTNSSPSTSRRRRMALLTAGWVTDSLCAARVRLRSAMTSSKTRSRFRSKERKFKGVMVNSSSI